MHEIARSEGDLVSVAGDQLRRTLTAYWHDEPPPAARRLAGTTATGVEVMVCSVPYATRAKHDAAERIFAAAAAGRIPRLQIVRWNAAYDGLEIGFASPEFEQVAADEGIRRLLAELAVLPAVVVRHGRIRSV